MNHTQTRMPTLWDALQIPDETIKTKGEATARQVRTLRSVDLDGVTDWTLGDITDAQRTVWAEDWRRHPVDISTASPTLPLCGPALKCDRWLSAWSKRLLLLLQTKQEVYAFASLLDRDAMLHSRKRSCPDFVSRTAGDVVTVARYRAGRVIKAKNPGPEWRHDEPRPLAYIGKHTPSWSDQDIVDWADAVWAAGEHILTTLRDHSVDCMGHWSTRMWQRVEEEQSGQHGPDETWTQVDPYTGKRTSYSA